MVITLQIVDKTNLTFIGPCFIIYFCSKTNQMHNNSNLFYFGTIHVSDSLSVHHQESNAVCRVQAVAQLVKALCYKPEGRGFDSLMISLEFFIDIIFPAALWPWG